MVDFLRETVECFQEIIDKDAALPAALHLFEINKVGIPLKENEQGCSTILSQNCCGHTREHAPTSRWPCHSWRSKFNCLMRTIGKNCRLLWYLQVTIDLPLILSTENLTIITQWVDAAFAVHGDMKSYTRDTMSLGTGPVYSSLTGQNINTIMITYF